MSEPLAVSVETLREVLTEVRHLKDLVKALGHESLRLRPSPKVLTLVAAAKEIGIDRRTLAKEIDAGKIGTVIVGRSRMVPLSEVERFSQPKHAKPPQRRPAGGNAAPYSVAEELAKLRKPKP